MNNLELEISNPCNEHCVHCYRHCFNATKGFLSVKQAKNALEQAKSLGAKNVTITGGEALLNPDWKEIVKTADESGFRISFFTNGSLMKETDADFLSTVKNLKEVQFSLYSLEENDHDSVTNLKGSCEKTKKAIEMLRKRNVPIFLSVPAMQNNKNSFTDVLRWADSENINSCSDCWIFGTSDYKKSNLSQRFSDSDLENYFEESMKDNGALSYVWGKGYGKRNLSQIDFYGGAANSLCINGNGDIFPMIGWYEKLGNIETDSLKEICENHPLLKKIRTIKASDFPECVNCQDSDFCDFCPSPHLTANNGELYKLDKDYCHFVHLRKMYAKRRDEILNKSEEK